jgi:SAM-dependent methyltransferase
VSSVVDGGVSYKRAEIGISAKVDDPNFFSPGYSSPFNPHSAEFTLYLIKLFGAAVPLLELKTGDTLIDSGCGYAWTTEWLYKSGVEAIGVDICRTYLEIGMQRMGVDRPHLVVADVENLPIRSTVVDAVLAFESAHHIPDRKKAMAGFSRVLQPAGRMVLAEPGAAHEDAQISVDVMSKYGILEKGMELDDVLNYVAGTDMGKPEQIFLVRASDGEVGSTIDRAFLRTHSVVEGNLFRIYRQQGALDALKTAWENPRRVVWPKVKRRLKGALVRLGLE